MLGAHRTSEVVRRDSDWSTAGSYRRCDQHDNISVLISSPGSDNPGFRGLAKRPGRVAVFRHSQDQHSSEEQKPVIDEAMRAAADRDASRGRERADEQSVEDASVTPGTVACSTCAPTASLRAAEVIVLAGAVSFRDLGEREICPTGNAKCATRSCRRSRRAPLPPDRRPRCWTSPGAPARHRRRRSTTSGPSHEANAWRVEPASMGPWLRGYP